jgi:hypothetical protein
VVPLRSSCLWRIVVIHVSEQVLLSAARLQR